MLVHYTCTYCFPVMLSVCYCLFVEWRSKIWFLLFFNIRSHLGKNTTIVIINFGMCHHFSDILQHLVQIIVTEKYKSCTSMFSILPSIIYTNQYMYHKYKANKIENFRFDIPCFYFLNMFTLHMHVHCTCTSINRRLMTMTVLNKKSQSLIIDNGPWCLQHLQE